MRRPRNPVGEVRDHWIGRRCPMCGDAPIPRHIAILSSYTFHCSSCDAVIEGFELYRGAGGELYTQNHKRLAPVQERGKRVKWEEVPSEQAKG